MLRYFTGSLPVSFRQHMGLSASALKKRSYKPHQLYLITNTFQKTASRLCTDA
jgi:hypothetical protein